MPNHSLFVRIVHLIRFGKRNCERKLFVPIKVFSFFFHLKQSTEMKSVEPRKIKTFSFGFRCILFQFITNEPARVIRQIKIKSRSFCREFLFHFINTFRTLAVSFPFEGVGAIFQSDPFLHEWFVNQIPKVNFISTSVHRPLSAHGFSWYHVEMFFFSQCHKRNEFHWESS